MLVYLAYCLQAGVGLFFIGHGWDEGAPGKSWSHLLIGIVLTMIGLGLINSAVRRYDSARARPYVWRCDIGKCRESKVGIEASDERLVEAWRVDHLKREHLMEP